MSAEAVPNARARDQPTKQSLELKLLIDLGKGQPTPVRLQGENDSVSIGRGSDCEVVVGGSGVSAKHCVLALKRKGRDLSLHVQDLSRNGTGVRNAKQAAADRPWKELGNGDEEVLHHRSQLLLPLKQKVIEAEDRRMVITVVFVLPDAWDPLTETGRWFYEEKLGEGGLAAVYRAKDMTGKLGLVAVKVSKFKGLPAASPQNRHVYALYREARWSIDRLHNVNDPRYLEESARLFARYLEDHTGFGAHGEGDFDAVRKRFEARGFDWNSFTFSPALASEPYVVIELVNARLLQAVLEGSPPLDVQEKQRIVRQCAESLVYISSFGAIHRDFRGCNIFLQGRGPICEVKVIDLGFMISVEPEQVQNPNIAVRCAWQNTPSTTGTSNPKIRFDWAPPEVRVKDAPNFTLPGSSFDVFSFGVLILKLLKGRTWTSETLHSPKEKLQAKIAELGNTVKELHLTRFTLQRMLEHEIPGKRPTPLELLDELAPDAKRVKKGLPQPAAAAGGGLPPSDVPADPTAHGGDQQLQELDALAEAMRQAAQALLQQQQQMQQQPAAPETDQALVTPSEEPGPCHDEALMTLADEKAPEKWQKDLVTPPDQQATSVPALPAPPTPPAPQQKENGEEDNDLHKMWNEQPQRWEDSKRNKGDAWEGWEESKQKREKHGQTWDNSRQRSEKSWQKWEKWEDSRQRPDKSWKDSRHSRDNSQQSWGDSKQKSEDSQQQWEDSRQRPEKSWKDHRQSRDNSQQSWEDSKQKPEDSRQQWEDSRQRPEKSWEDSRQSRENSQQSWDDSRQRPEKSQQRWEDSRQNGENSQQNWEVSEQKQEGTQQGQEDFQQKLEDFQQRPEKPQQRWEDSLQNADEPEQRHQQGMHPQQPQNPAASLPLPGPSSIAALPPPGPSSIAQDLPCQQSTENTNLPKAIQMMMDARPSQAAHVQTSTQQPPQPPPPPLQHHQYMQETLRPDMLPQNPLPSSAMAMPQPPIQPQLLPTSSLQAPAPSPPLPPPPPPPPPPAQQQEEQLNPGEHKLKAKSQPMVPRHFEETNQHQDWQAQTSHEQQHDGSSTSRRPPTPPRRPQRDNSHKGGRDDSRDRRSPRRRSASNKRRPNDSPRRRSASNKRRPNSSPRRRSGSPRREKRRPSPRRDAPRRDSPCRGSGRRSRSRSRRQSSGGDAPPWREKIRHDSKGEDQSGWQRWKNDRSQR